MSPELALGFGRYAEEYERGRPEWPEEVVSLPGVPCDAVVLDLAAGTGKLTRVLARRFARVIAVEPDQAMRARIAGAEVLRGFAEEIPLADASVDAVFVAQAFHWFDVPRAVAEVARVLRPGGTLALVWVTPADGGLLPADLAPPGMDAMVRRWRREFRAHFEGAPFGEFSIADVVQEQDVRREDAIAYFASVSWVNSLPAGERAAFFDALERVLDRERYRRRWLVEVAWTRRDG